VAAQPWERRHLAQCRILFVKKVKRLECGSLEAVSKLRITGNRTRPAPEARQTIARGERSEPLVRGANRRSPGGAKDIDKKSLSPLRGSSKYKFLPEVRYAHPWLLSDAPFGGLESESRSDLEFRDSLASPGIERAKISPERARRRKTYSV
jgi:hypothetical protein